MGRFATIRQAAQALGLSEFYVRRLVKTGRCPGFYSASRFYVNLAQLEAQLMEESQRNSGGKVSAGE